MSKAIELFNLLKRIERMAATAASRFDGAMPDTLAVFTDKAALEQIEVLAAGCITLINVGAADGQAVEPRSQSSVEIKESAKGEAQVTVKAYEGSDVSAPAAVAISTYLDVKAKLRAPQTAAVPFLEDGVA